MNTTGVLLVSPPANRDINDIVFYIAEAAGGSRAQKVLDRIRRELERLAYVPEAGPVREDFNGRPRTFPIHPWVVLYEPLPDGTGIEVLRVIDGRRDLPRHFRRS